MSTPVRVQLSRAKGWRMPPNTVKVDRTTPWGNAFKVDSCRMSNGDWEVFLCTDGKFAGPPKGHYRTKALATAATVAMYRAVIEGQAGGLMRRRAWDQLRGKNLACWCKLPKPGEPDICHAAVLLELANRPTTVQP